LKLTDSAILRAGTALAALLLVSAGSLTQAAPQFEDATTEAGVVYQQHVPRTPPGCIIMTVMDVYCQTDRMTGGAAVGDVDGDGDLDLFVTRLDAPDILFRNKGDGTFEDGSSEAGFSKFNLQSNAAAFADIDNDGDLDLYVTVVGNQGNAVNNRNYLFINDGGGRFSEEALSRGAHVTSPNYHRSYSAAFGDYDKDGWLDLHVTEWVPPNPSHSRLLRNLGPASPGVFEDVTTAAGATLEGVHGFSTTFTDLDQDGWPDLAVAADFGTSQLLWNNGDGTFTNGTTSAQVGTDENGMGSTFGDFDGDGDLDWFVTSIYDPAPLCDPNNPDLCVWGYTGNRLYRYDGNRTFSDATDAAGVRVGHWGWGTAFFDYDNDADLDLILTNGVDFPVLDLDDPYNADPMRMWENDGSGSMIELSAAVGISDTASGKGLLVFDYERDGDLDIFVINNGGQPRLYRNVGGNARDWLRVNTVGVSSNRDGLGARITLQEQPRGPSQVREMGTSTHFLGQSERTAHFGLRPGTEPVALVRIVWPSGRLQSLGNIPRNSTLTAVEPDCLDSDGDGFCVEVDCNDFDPDIHPGAWEYCDGGDHNCDGRVDATRLRRECSDPARRVYPAGATP